MKGKLLFVLLSFGLVGCETMLPYRTEPDSVLIGLGRGVAEVNTCANLGFVSKKQAFEFSYYVMQLLDITVYDEKIYEDAFQSRTAFLNGYTDEFLETNCSSLLRELPQTTAFIKQRYERAYESLRIARMGAISSMAASTAALGDSIAQSASYSVSSSMPTGQVTFGQEGTSNSNYLVNTPNGAVLCNVSSSGYVNCY